MTLSQTCACGSQISASECCLPFIQGKRKPATAEQLLRSRYTAFTLGDVDYIVTTHHSKTVGEVNREEIEKWSKGSKWIGFKILQQEAGTASDTQGMIVFHVQYEMDGKMNDHHEQSVFEKENGEWKFLDAQGLQQGPIRRQEPKIGRNDACTCGSGKKYKKCCGMAA
ncbi:MAG: YchJ family protein [Methylotenera sp.]|nr:YchJ family protein [Oligoflexia bacterium]